MALWTLALQVRRLMNSRPEKPSGGSQQQLESPAGRRRGQPILPSALGTPRRRRHGRQQSPSKMLQAAQAQEWTDWQTQQEGSSLHTRRRVLTRTQPCHTLILDFQPPEL
ncbi:uncharacterized protein [Gorilla gorilla gorilla]|uniref:uncharacterized protein n=1 Tax=Gorilla gorilla gorilla TaxID=9595 RepID=UPI00300ADF92